MRQAHEKTRRLSRRVAILATYKSTAGESNLAMNYRACKPPMCKQHKANRPHIKQRTLQTSIQCVIGLVVNILDHFAQSLNK